MILIGRSKMIVLNEKQQQFVDLAINWFHHSSSPLIQLAGFAGTGKSVVISEIVKRLNLRPNEILPMAYTGQACTIMRKRGFSNACTCHSGLFSPVQEYQKDEFSGAIKIDKTFNTPILNWKFILKDLSASNIKLIVLDEAWMIPKKFKRFIDATNIKVIAAGDPNQLPPISDEPGYLVDGDIFYLTELVRQSEKSPIIYLANRIREGRSIEFGTYGNSAMVIRLDDLSDMMLANSNMVLCCINDTRDRINTKIRSDIKRITTNFPIFGERIICRKNNWKKEVDGIPLVNGLTGTIISPSGIDRFNGETLKIDFLADMLDKPFTNVDINFKYINSNHQDKKLLSKNPYLKGERFEYAYASTVHLSQGSEYLNGVYISESFDKNISRALNYTAITRFKNSLIYVKHPKCFW